MRLPLAPELDTRNGAANKDARLTNMLVEDDSGTPVTNIRPGLSTVATSSGNGRGLVAFNDVLISVYGTALGAGTAFTSVGTVSGEFFDFVQSPLP